MAIAVAPTRVRRTFRTDRRGNVAILFALVLVPVLGLIGLAVDYSRASSTSSDMQAALDSAALMLARNPSLTTMTNAQLQATASSYFLALFNRPNILPAVQTATYNSTNSTVTLTASASVSTTVLGGWPFRLRTMSLASSTTVTWGMGNLQVALVLDNTGSMADYNKLTNLQTAAHQLLAQLQAAATNGASVQVAIIPFTTDVNIGTSYASSSWIDWSNWSTQGSIENGMTCSNGNNGWGGGWGGFGWGGFGGATCGSSNHSGWNGCVMDRGDSSGPDSANYDILTTAPISGTVASYFPADQSPWCPLQLIPLSTNWTALNTEVTNMTANGNTNQAIGLVWGWQALTQSAPLNAPAPPANTQKIIILLTDGLNTQDRWSSTQSYIDAREQLLCTNIKNAGITIYTYWSCPAIRRSCRTAPATRPNISRSRNPARSSPPSTRSGHRSPSCTSPSDGGLIGAWHAPATAADGMTGQSRGGRSSRAEAEPGVSITAPAGGAGREPAAARRRGSSPRRSRCHRRPAGR
jgi:Flp pilus assembly protein TadG